VLSNQSASDKYDILREHAEGLLLHRPGTDAKKLADMLELISELKSRQVELKIRNQELSSLHREYADLYQFALCGYVTLNSKGIITRANLAAASLLQTESGRLLHSGFTAYVPAEWEGLFNDARRNAGQTGEKQSIELPLRRETSQPLWVRIDILADRDENGAVVQWRMTLIDINES
jgi:PAS domain-containing protein